MPFLPVLLAVRAETALDQFVCVREMKPGQLLNPLSLASTVPVLMAAPAIAQAQITNVPLTQNPITPHLDSLTAQP